MQRIVPNVDRESAQRFLSRHRWWMRRSRVDQLAGESEDGLPFLECVWLPAYELRYQSESGMSVVCLVDGMAATARLHAPDGYRVDSNLVRESFAPIINEDVAHHAARKTILRALVFRRRATGLELARPDATRLVRYPYWVYYVRRRSIIDIRALDAVTGNRVGYKLKLGLLDAFRRQASVSAMA